MPTFQSDRKENIKKNALYFLHNLMNGSLLDFLELRSISHLHWDRNQSCLLKKNLWKWTWIICISLLSPFLRSYKHMGLFMANKTRKGLGVIWSLAAWRLRTDPCRSRKTKGTKLDRSHFFLCMGSKGFNLHRRWDKGKFRDHCNYYLFSLGA